MNRYLVIGTTAVLILLLGIAMIIVVWAADGPQQGRSGPMGPPPEAVEACKDKSEGADVQFTGRRGDKVEASCKLMNGQMVAVPKGGFPNQGSMAPDKTSGRQ
jgi:hypothetical protein